MDKLSIQVNTNSDTLKKGLRKTKDLKESRTVNQDLIDNKIAKFEKKIRN